jgi:predicted phage terminase large subunit-like protein
MDPQGDYLWSDVFPDVQVIKTNAQDMMIDLGRNKKDGKRFSTLEFSSVGSGNAGKVRAEQLLYCDDLVDGIEAAMSRERMDKLWQLYTTDLRQRKIGQCRELHIATRWSVHDVIGRLEANYGDSEKSRFIVLPALDENDQSNFDYGNSAGFTTSFYHQQRDIMDDASWRALYMGQPIEREGQLYPEQELRRYFELPDGEPDAILAVCDTKDKGIDYCVMPIAYQYGNDYYIDCVVCDNSAPNAVEARLVSVLLYRKVHMARFESNAAGGKVAEKIQKEVKEKGGKTKITTKFTSANKETKIIINSPFVKDRFLFKDNSVIKQDKEYKKFLSMLTGYTMAGKNKNDDAPDAIAMLAEYVQSLTANKVEVFKRPF